MSDSNPREYSVWLVRAIAWYPRESWNPDDKEPLVDRPKRPKARAPQSWYESKTGSRNLVVRVMARTREEAEQKAKQSDYVETLRDKPATRMETLK